jgi:hypothetical protein
MGFSLDPCLKKFYKVIRTGRSIHAFTTSVDISSTICPMNDPCPIQV